MAVCFDAMNSIVVLDDDDDDEEKKPHPSSSSSQPSTHPITPPRARVPAPTHITQSPFASAKKESHVLQAENQRLFTEFVEHCSTHILDHPEVMTFLHAKHAKASLDFLASVEFRNTLGRCLTRAQANRSKTFVYINELCTVLKQHSAKRRQTITKAQLKPASVKKKEQPSTSGQPEEKQKQDEEKEKVDEDEEKNTKKASRRQIAYLENLLKVYNDEIRRLQEKELSLNDLMAEDSGYIQEHKLKRKMMKIYDKLCELKGCNTLTGRVIEQRISYSGTRYPEINKRIERFINSPEAQLNPPDYSDILQQVQRANERHSLSLSRKQLVQIAQMAFQETGNRLQERRHLDMVYNFGSHLTDTYKPATDPAMRDSTLQRKLRSNREAALTSLEQVINKYSLQQDDTEEEERRKRLEKKAQKSNEKKEGEEAEMEVPAEGEGSAVREGSAEGEELPEEEEEEDDDVSSDPDIEEEIQASTAQAGPEEDEEEDESIDMVNQNTQNGEAEPSGVLEQKREGDKPVTSESEKNAASPVLGPGFSPLMEDPSPTDSPSQSEPTELDEGNKSAKHNAEDAVSSNQQLTVSVSTGIDTSDWSLPLLTNHVSLPPSPVPLLTNNNTSEVICETRSANCSPRPPSPSATRKRKRNHLKESTRKSHNGIQTYTNESEVDITLDSGVAKSPLQADSTRADTPQQEVVTSSQSTPPPKKNKVNVATQCDPDEIIVLSDSE